MVSMSPSKERIISPFWLPQYLSPAYNRCSFSSFCWIVVFELKWHSLCNLLNFWKNGIYKFIKCFRTLQKFLTNRERLPIILLYMMITPEINDITKNISLIEVSINIASNIGSSYSIWKFLGIISGFLSKFMSSLMTFGLSLKWINLFLIKFHKLWFLWWPHLIRY